MLKKRFLLSILFLFLCILSFSPNKVYAETQKVYLGGYPVGITINSRGAYVVGVCDVVNADLIYSPSKDAGIMAGDIILSVDGVEVNTSKDISDTVKDGNVKIIEYSRGGNKIITNVTPRKDNLGKYKLGVFVKDGVSGIGTITYLTKNEVGCLGHPILDDNYEIIKACGGKIFSCNITGAIKGVKGRPGELRGVFDEKTLIAELTCNKNCGVFGNKINKEYLLTEIEIGQAKMGDAYIYTTVSGNIPQKYSVSIIKNDNYRDDKNLVVKITDKRLLEQTNGIVQGMSGSPIVQDNKLVGAITHVFTNDPTRGFGITIDKMLNH